ncbi:IclR family transcriptional regulator [Sporolactobacillus sp. THM7-7]|nr:IclR family transcriptional regulator [Sporolactobacillus sp. THM7-7]
MNNINRIHDISKKNNSGIGVLDKAVHILSYLSMKGEGGLSEIVSSTGMARSTVYRLLKAMEIHHLVVHTSGRRFALGSRLIGWGEKSKYRTWIECARPILVQLRDVTGVSTQLFVREGNERVCIASEEPFIGLKNTVPLGAVFPLSAGSAGKVLVVWSEGNIIAEEQKTIKKRGWAESVAEREPGVASVSAPVFGPARHLYAAICLSGPIHRLGEHPGQRFSALVVDAAKKIEKTLYDAMR